MLILKEIICFPFLRYDLTVIENNYHFTAQQAAALACVYLSLTPLTVFCKFSIYMSYITILCSDSLGYFLLRSPLLTKDIYIKKEKKKKHEYR